MNRPIIFISSTVHDFGDMRSALKDHLGTRGCKVLSSEFSDFPRSLDRHSYQECLDTIDLAHLFVLLIGRRRGGWYDEKRRISITRAEFEHAVKRAEAGRIRILAFARREVVDYHQASKELRKQLATNALLDDVQRDAILYRDTQFMDDPRALIEFIDAVTRNQQTAAAVRGGGPPPVSNWLQPFTGFAEIRQAIEPLITGGLEVGKASGRKALEVQLSLLLQGILPRTIADGPSSPGRLVRTLVDQIDLTEGEAEGDVRIERRAFATLDEFSTLVCHAHADPRPLQYALTSDLLMAFDPAGSLFEETPEYLLLARIVAACHALDQTMDRSAALHRYRPAHTGGLAVVLPRHLVEGQLTRLMRWADLADAVRSLAHSLRGGPLTSSPPMSSTPMRHLSADDGAKHITLDEIRAYVDAWTSA